eukprot:Skav208728  [mRNA]  locus=scaffold615:184604:184825:+ [translate_table: standard]
MGPSLTRPCCAVEERLVPKQEIHAVGDEHQAFLGGIFLGRDPLRRQGRRRSVCRRRRPGRFVVPWDRAAFRFR